MIPQRDYTAHHLRSLTTIVADSYGLPRKGFYYENGMWRTARLLHGRRDEINWHHNQQVPVALVCADQFANLKARIEKRTGWTSGAT